MATFSKVGLRRTSDVIKDAIRKNQLERDLERLSIYDEVHKAGYKKGKIVDGPVEYAVLKDRENG